MPRPDRDSEPAGTAPRPPAPARQALPDQLRGLALLGIVLVNMPFLALGSDGFAARPARTAADEATEFVVVALAQGKFYLLFSFLFGYSLTLLLRSRGADGLTRYRRRLTGLAMLGAAHATLFFIGDILVSYALLGGCLLLFVHRSDRAVLVAALCSFLAGVGALLVALAVVLSDPAGGSGSIVDSPDTLDRALSGSFADGVAGRAAALPGALAFQAVLNWCFALSMFLLGLLAGRRGLLARPHEHLLLWRRLLVVGALVGLPSALVSAALFTGADPSTGAGTQQQTVAVVLGFSTAPALTGGYVALAALATRSKALALVAPAGQMSLTGYLGESILLAAVFCGWGLGLLGEVGAFHSALVALAVWAVLEVFAKVWLSRFRHGPFEWLLRAWSYRQVPPWRR